MLTPEGLGLLAELNTSPAYCSAVQRAVEALVTMSEADVSAILLFGGLVRDRRATDEWSDIDMVVIYNDIRARNARKLAEEIGTIEDQSGIRLDIVEISLPEVSDPARARFFMNSAIIGALRGLSDVSLLLHGQAPKCAFSSAQLADAHLHYMCSTLSAFREYLIEVLYRSTNEKHLRHCLQRVTRWTFSIVRASLRLFGIWVHPYEASIAAVLTLPIAVNVAVLVRLADIRRNFNTYRASPTDALFRDVEAFLESYVPRVLQCYASQARPR